MLIVTNEHSLSRALSSSIDPRLKQLLTDRVRQLDVEDLFTAARFVIVQPGETIADLDQALGFSSLQNLGDGTRYCDPDFSPGWEWIEDHGFAFELVFIFTDDGFAHVVLVPNAPGISTDLLNLCRTYAADHVGS
jgi:hypothetical protein